MWVLECTVILTVSYLRFLYSQTTDPCTSYQAIQGEEKRSIDYKIDLNTDYAFSDDRLSKGWYRIVSNAGEEIATASPALFKCGTWYPIWLNGTIPQDVGDQKTIPVCLHNFLGDCKRTWNIQIKRCSSYLVYELLPSPVIDSAYCFGNGSKCPDGMSSETGYTPGCSAKFPKDVFTPNVKVSRKNSLQPSEYGYFLEPVFHCIFTELANSYVYDVQWFINDHTVKTVPNNTYNDINQTELRAADWKDKYHMNMVVKCSVRVRNSVGSTPGYHQYSNSFVAGVIPLGGYVYSVKEGSSINITLQATVPLGCISEYYLDSCKETIKVAFPRIESCSNKSVSDIIISEQCGTDIKASDWNAKHNITIYGNLDNLYNKDSVRTTVLSFQKPSSDKDLSGAWDKLEIPDISIQIMDQDIQLSGKFCETWADPYYHTFDMLINRNYYYDYNSMVDHFTEHITGEYVLYRHKREPLWVHVLSSGCYWGTCNVGVAIRSHNSLFVVRTFDVISNPIVYPQKATFSGSRDVPMINFRNCDDKTMEITSNGRDFTVKLATGTVITFYIQHNVNWDINKKFFFINHIIIKPSVLDVEQTEGLCGFLSSNGNATDDFKERGTGKVVGQRSFVDSWFINETSGESLFKETPSFINNKFYYKPFCTCVKQAPNNTPFGDNFNEVNCNLTYPLEQCYKTKTNIDTYLYSSCTSRQLRDTTYADRWPNSARVARSTEDSDDVKEDLVPLSYSPDFLEKYIPPESDWPNGWNEESARLACTQGIEATPAVTVCTEYANINIARYVSSCILDIKATGNTTLLSVSIQTLLAGCMIEVSRNQTLILSNSSSEGVGFISQSMLDVIQSQLCFNNCSENGICEKGSCICKNGFVGDDCSISHTKPPSSIYIPDGGKCGTRKRNCKKTNIYGNFDSTEVWCNLFYFQVINDVKQSTSTPEIVKADVVSHVMVSCPLKTSSKRKKRSIFDTSAEGFDISLSNDGVNFGNNVTLIIFDEDCYSCNPTTATCIFLDSCPLQKTTLDSTIRPLTSYIDSTTVGDNTSIHVTSNSTIRHQTTSNIDSTIKEVHSYWTTTIAGTMKTLTTNEITNTTKVEKQASEDMSISIIISASVICLGVVIFVAFLLKCKVNKGPKKRITRKKQMYIVTA